MMRYFTLTEGMMPYPVWLLSYMLRLSYLLYAGIADHMEYVRSSVQVSFSTSTARMYSTELTVHDVQVQA